jgi:hypothetical protein
METLINDMTGVGYQSKKDYTWLYILIAALVAAMVIYLLSKHNKNGNPN